MSLEGQKQREIICTKCGKKENEKVFGVGFPGWNKISEITDKKIVEGIMIISGKAQKVSQEVQVSPELCPSCMKKFCEWITEKPKQEEKK